MSYEIKDLRMGSANIEYFLFNLNNHLPKKFAKVVPLEKPEEIRIGKIRKLTALLRGETPRKVTKLLLKREDEINELALIHPFFRGVVLTLEEGYDNENSNYSGTYERLQVDIKTCLPLSFGVLNPMTKTIFTRYFEEIIASEPIRDDYDCSSWKSFKLDLEETMPTHWLYPQ